MNILFIDTSTKLAKVFFGKAEKKASDNFSAEIFGEAESYDAKAHSVNLISCIDKALSEHEKSEIDIVAVANGPGSYTGLRIGLATAKALAFSLSKPLVTINTLDYLAKSAEIAMKNEFEEEKQVICAMIDARNHQAFYGIFEGVRALEYGADDIDAIVGKAEDFARTANFDCDKIIYCGDGSTMNLAEGDKKIDNCLGNGWAALILTAEKYENTEKSEFDPKLAEANYMKDVHVTLKSF